MIRMGSIFTERYVSVLHAEKCDEHHLETVIEMHKVTILWGFIIHTDKYIKVNRPDIEIKHYKQNRNFS